VLGSEEEDEGKTKQIKKENKGHKRERKIKKKTRNKAGPCKAAHIR